MGESTSKTLLNVKVDRLIRRRIFILAVINIGLTGFLILCTFVLIECHHSKKVVTMWGKKYVTKKYNSMSLT